MNLGAYLVSTLMTYGPYPQGDYIEKWIQKIVTYKNYSREKKTV